MTCLGLNPREYANSLLVQLLENAVDFTAQGEIGVIVRLDTGERSQDSHDRESNETAKTQFSAILTNIEIAKEGIPMCQDTGILIFYIKVGHKFPFIGEIKSALKKATVLHR